MIMSKNAALQLAYRVARRRVLPEVLLRSSSVLQVVAAEATLAYRGHHRPLDHPKQRAFPLPEVCQCVQIYRCSQDYFFD